MNAFDTFTAAFAPRWTLERVRARAALRVTRNYDAAQPGRRTSGWTRNRGDINALLQVAGAELRNHARDLLRNNGYTRRAQNVIANNVVGWGIVPKTTDPEAAALWRAWADSTECDSEGRHTFAGLQSLVMRSLISDGEVLIRRRQRRPDDGLSIPLQLQVLEIDYLDTSKTAPVGPTGGPIEMGVEFDLLGRRSAYWLFADHPGNAVGSVAGASYRVPASEIAHVFQTERPGQSRGASWLATAIVPLKDLDEYEDAELVKQKIAACFAAFVTDPDGSASPIAALESGTTDSGVQVESFEPGMISHLPPGKAVTMANPPGVTNDAFTIRNLRKIAAGLGVTYEDLTGDYSQVNFSSARMGRIVHQAYVRNWQSTVVIPQLCGAVWRWAMTAAAQAGDLDRVPPAEWTAPPLPMIEPDKEGLAYSRLVRNGVMTFSEMVREQGGDPDAHFAEYAADQKRLDALGIKLDSDVRAVSQAGLTQERAGLGKGGPPEAPPASDEKNSDDFEITEG